MPIFLDRHEIAGLTHADIAEAHRKDLDIQDQYGVRFLTYWFDEARGTGFCLIEAPDFETAMRVHEEAHGEVAVNFIEVELAAVEAFLGRVSDPEAAPAGTVATKDAAFRAVMFTDITGSTRMTERLGDLRAVEMVRAHDAIVRRALGDAAGREVKHTGDGMMASFPAADEAVRCARAIQTAFDAFNLASDEKLRVRIGIDAGEPVEDSNDLFGSTVQLAARICHAAPPESIVVSRQVRDLAGGSAGFEELGARPLKGFAKPVPLFRVRWR